MAAAHRPASETVHADQLTWTSDAPVERTGYHHATTVLVKLGGQVMDTSPQVNDDNRLAGPGGNGSAKVGVLADDVGSFRQDQWRQFQQATFLALLHLLQLSLGHVDKFLGQRTLLDGRNTEQLALRNCHWISGNNAGCCHDGKNENEGNTCRENPG